MFSIHPKSKKKLNQQVRNKNSLSYADIMKSSNNLTTSNSFEILQDEDDNSFDVQQDFVYNPPKKRKKNSTNSPQFSNVLYEPQPSTSYNKHFPLLSESSSKNIPGFQKISSDDSVNKKEQNSNDNSTNNILKTLEELVDFLDFSDFWKKIIKKILPFLASLLEKLNSFGPLIASLFSF